MDPEQGGSRTGWIRRQQHAHVSGVAVGHMRAACSVHHVHARARVRGCQVARIHQGVQILSGERV